MYSGITQTNLVQVIARVGVDCALAALIMAFGVRSAGPKQPDATGLGETDQETLGLGGVVGGAAFSFSSSELKDA